MVNVFVVLNCKMRKVEFATLSARKALNALEKGKRIEVWNNNALIEKVYSKETFKMQPYIAMEKEFIGKRQARAEHKNKMRKRKDDFGGHFRN